MQKKIYMDYAAGTPVDKRVLTAMEPCFGEYFGNPSSLHSFGQKTAAAVFEARRKIAVSLGCLPDEIIFTGSATEANNLAIRGIFKNLKLKVKSSDKNFIPKIIISAIEHESVLETARDLERSGVEVVLIPVSRDGIIDLKKLKAGIDRRTILVSVMYANNEIGTIQPISKIANMIREYRQDGMYPLFHTDAVQAFNYLKCDVALSGVDLMTMSAHKIYGPKGVGLLYTRSGVDLAPIITGGDQERGWRSGTENVPYIVGFGEAVAIAEKMREREAGRILNLRNYFWEKIKAISGLRPRLNGSLQNRLPNNLNIYFPGVLAHDLLIALDISGVAVSTGAACHSRSSSPSRVVMALGYSQERAGSSVRFTLGRETSKQDIDNVVLKLNTTLKS